MKEETMSQEHSILIRVKSFVIPTEKLFSVMNEFDMVTYEKKRQYQEIIDEGKLLVSCYRKAPLQTCFDLLFFIFKRLMLLLELFVNPIHLQRQ